MALSYLSPVSRFNAFDDLKVLSTPVVLDRKLQYSVVAQAFSRVIADERYWKIGRTAGLTGGILTGIDQGIPLNVQRTLYNAHSNVKKIRRPGRRVEIVNNCIVYSSNVTKRRPNG